MALERVLDRRSAAELRQVERHVVHIEETAAWQRVHGLAQRAHLSLIAGREDWADQHLTELGAVVDRRLRQLNGGDAA